MTEKYADLLAAPVPQTEAADPRQVPNAAGGYAFEVTPRQRLDRFLITGAAEGTYYVSAKDLTKGCANTIADCLKEDGARTVARIVEVSESGRAPKNDPALFALALCATSADPAVKRLALEAMPRVARTGTMLFQFVHAVDKLGGWGRMTARHIARWYSDKAPGDLAYQLLKYQQRDGWSHRDVLRLSHPRGLSTAQHAAVRWALKCGLGDRAVKRRGGPNPGNKPERTVTYPAVEREALPALLLAYERLVAATPDELGVVTQLIREHRMTHEMVPGAWKAHAEVWEALSEHMPLHALVRNLGAMTARGTLAPLSARTKAVSERLVDRAAIRKARLHPIALLMALRQYQAGRGDKGKLTWSPLAPIVDALDAAFYLAFDNVVPTGKRIMLALDVSGSMGVNIGAGTLTAREVTAAMAMVTARTEAEYHITGFGTKLIALPITASQRLTEVLDTISNLPFGGTDCALPWKLALKNKVPLDACVIYTDSETWAGDVHPHAALRAYREKVQPLARQIVCATTSTGFTIADPADPLSLDIAGFDAATPSLIADFARGE